MTRRISGWACAIVLLAGSGLRADQFTYVDEDGQTLTVNAKLTGTGGGVLALEMPDGQIRLVPQEAIKTRLPGEDPQPLSDDEMIAQLTEQFGAELFRAYKQRPYVIGLVLSSPLPKSQETRVRGVLTKAAAFMRNVESVFLTFGRSVRFPNEPPRFPLVLLIFETDADFEKYATEVTGGRGLSAQNIAGFYSGLTNHLAVRLTECATFEVPLHEAIHQQVYNRGVLQRLSPVPAWFNEGIATGFEGEGERINIGPNKINSNYARRSQTATRVNWADVVADDRAFRGDVLAGDAYTHAWSLHWLLVNNYKSQYSQYIKLLSQKTTLGDSSPEERTKEFEEAFGKGVAAMQQEFYTALEAGLKRQKLPPEKETVPGQSVTQASLGEVQLKAVRRLDLGGALLVEGTLKNISPIRDLSFHVTVETDAGTYAEWHVPNLAVSKSSKLDLQTVQKVMQNGGRGGASSFFVKVKSVAPESEEAQRWGRGGLPVPVYGGR